MGAQPLACHPCRAERVFFSFLAFFFLPSPRAFFPCSSLFKRQDCPAWHLNPTSVTVGAAACPPAVPPCPPQRGPSPAALPLPTACEGQSGESVLSAKEITDGEIMLRKTRCTKTCHAEHCPRVWGTSDEHPGCLGCFLMGAPPCVDTDAFLRLCKRQVKGAAYKQGGFQMLLAV